MRSTVHVLRKDKCGSIRGARARQAKLGLSHGNRERVLKVSGMQGRPQKRENEQGQRLTFATFLVYFVLVGHRLVAGTNKSFYCDHRLRICAVGSVPVQLGIIYKLCWEEPKHRSNNMCSRTFTGTHT